MLSCEKLRTSASLWAILASSGQASLNCTPGRLVAMGDSVPRISSGASGFGIERVDVRDAAAHPQEDDRAGFAVGGRRRFGCRKAARDTE